MKVAVWDTSALWHLVESDRDDVVHDLLLRSHPDLTSFTTRVVEDELRRGGKTTPGWISVESVDTLERLPLLLRWSSLIGSGKQDRGELTVFALAEHLGATAIVDDAAARKVARTAGLAVHGTLWVLGNALDRRHLTSSAAESILRDVVASGARLPCAPDAFENWWSHNRPPSTGVGPLG